MPANAEYCPTCGHTNAFVAPGSAITPSTPRPSTSEAAFVTPMPPPVFEASAASAASAGEDETSDAHDPAASGDTPQGGAPTVNIGASTEPARYTPPPAEAWQPGQYGSDATQVGQAPSQPPAYSPDPMQPAHGSAQYTPPPPGWQPGQTQNLPAQQYGAQGYGQPPQINYQYQQQPGVAGVPPRNPTVAFLLELLGIVGFLGIGHIYSGHTGRGIALLLGWWAYLLISGVLTIILVGFCMLVAVLIVPPLSGFWIMRNVERSNDMFRPKY